MKRPETINHLLEELREEGFHSTVATTPRSKAVVYLNPDDRKGMELTSDECALVFHSQDTVERFVDAIEQDLDEASLELYDLTIESELITLLETLFSAVDEM